VAPCTGGSSVDNVFRFATVVWQIMTEDGADSEEVKIVAVTKIIINLTNLNGH
jgi:hypothetical protein